ncbi:MAG: thiamine pyrophosphate-binding protein [Burkholderiales bacterium]
MALEKITVGELIARFLEQCGARSAFGVISIHNMPILDAFGRRAAAKIPGAIRFVPARSEAGAVNMADANARVSGGIGIAVTSTGTGAGNACGALVEALTAGVPVIHLTGQIELPYLDRDLGYIHEARSQPEMLASVSKAFYRIWSAQTALGTMREAVRTACTAPAGPVSVEIPIDVQGMLIDLPEDLSPLPVEPTRPNEASLDLLADKLSAAKRPLLWVGGGARGARGAVMKLAEMGIAVISSVQGRGVLPENHPMSLGALHMSGVTERFYSTCDAILVAGSRLRSNETLKYKLKLPRPLYRIDADPRQEGRAYPADFFIGGDAGLALEGLASRLKGRLKPDPAFASEVRAARAALELDVRQTLGPYEKLLDALAATQNYVWVRDITLSNSIWGNRMMHIGDPRHAVHATGGGIGQGIQQALGAALAAPDRKVLCLTGDGGLQLNIGELATLVQERANVLVILMNDGGYGVIKNIQDAQFGARHYFVDLHTPDFSLLAKSINLPHVRITDLAKIGGPLAELAAINGPAMLEIDMVTVGPFAAAYAGPPDGKAEKAKP